MTSIPIVPLRIALERFAAEKRLREDTELVVRGVPGVDTIRVSRRADRELIVTHINGDILTTSICVGTKTEFTTVRAEDARAIAQKRHRASQRRASRAAIRRDIIIVDGVRWTLVSDDASTRHREAVTANSKGQDVMVSIDINLYPYRMMCECGRVRYAKANALHEVKLCRVCQQRSRRERRRRKAKRQSA